MYNSPYSRPRQTATLVLVAPEIIHIIASYLSSTTCLASLTSTCRYFRSFFSVESWATCLINEFGPDEVLAEHKTYGGELEYDKDTRWVRPNSNNSKLGLYTRRRVMGDKDLVRLIISRGGRDRGECLTSAAVWGYASIVRILRDSAGSDPHYDGNHPFTMAIFNNHTDVIDALFEGGPIKEDNIWNDFLGREHDVVLMGMRHGKEMVQYLIESGIVDLSGRDNNFTFIWACALGCVELVEFLFEKGVRAQADPHGRNVIKEAIKSGGMDLYRTLVDVGGYPPVGPEDVDEGLMVDVAANGTVEDLQMLLRLKLDIVEEKGVVDKVLAAAARNMNGVKAAEFMLHVGGVPNLTLEGITQAGFQAIKGDFRVGGPHTEIVKMLLKAGADRNFQSNSEAVEGASVPIDEIERDWTKESLAVAIAKLYFLEFEGRQGPWSRASPLSPKDIAVLKRETWNVIKILWNDREDVKFDFNQILDLFEKEPHR
ncbi:hypothetical protein HK102_000851 [Quaeritorhiza haematococci]|nr:hypothetical protein HK102_000851 [Quaeritorhiza haematococci]